MYRVTPFTDENGDCAFNEFYAALKGCGVKNAQPRVKVYLQKLAEEGLNLLNTEMMDRIEDSIYELRPGPFRILCYLDNQAESFILLNGFRKQTAKTPESAKAQARELAKAYLVHKEERP
jgi:phage-related protein